MLSIRAKAFENATRDPISTQRKVLFEYIRRNSNTEYGRSYNFAAVKSIADYRKHVPLSNCTSMHLYLDRMARGEDNILTVDKPIFFGATSGTTNMPKLIPTTRYSEAKKAELLDLWGYYISRDHPDILKGKILALVSSEIEGYTPSGIPYGAESGHGYKHLSPLVRGLYGLPYEVFDIKNFEARYYCILRISMEQNITTIAALNPNMILLLCQKIPALQESIIRDIDNGTIDRTIDIEQALRSRIEKRMRPDPKRAAELRRILAEKGRLLPKDFWPKLELIECWKSGSMKVYLKELPLYFGNVPIRDMGCLSTETRSSIPITDDDACGILAIQTNFYEFIPKDEMGKADMRILLCDQLEKEKDYFLIVTTPGGLYRYDIDDVVRVKGFFNKTPLIEFVQKGQNVSSLAGEKLYESQVNDALNEALEKTGLFVEFFCAVPHHEGRAHYLFLTEFSPDSEKLSSAAKRIFLNSMEEGLRRQNREYAYDRDAQLLGPPVLSVVRQGEFEKYRQKRVGEGAHDSQFKHPELTTDHLFSKNFQIEEEICLE